MEQPSSIWTPGNTIEFAPMITCLSSFTGALYSRLNL